MNDNFKTLLTFVLGAVAGSACTWYFLSKKHEQEVDEINDQWSAYCDGLDEIKEMENEQDKEEPEEVPTRVAEERHYEPTSIQEAAANLPQPDTSDYYEEGDEGMDEPVVITPEEFSDLEYEGYATETLTLYADGVLTDFLDNVIENVDDVVGEESLERFGEYEQDTVFVRNDHLMTGYEIQRDNRTYAEVVGE